MSIKSSQKLRIAYFAEIFPSKSETWIHHEIRVFQSLGCNVRVFATRPHPENVAEELKNLGEITIYLPSIPKRRIFKALPLILRTQLLLPVLTGWLFDAKGLRRKVQVIRSFFHIASFMEDLKAFQPDIVYCHFAGSRANLALYYSLLQGTPFIIKMHANDVFKRPALFKLKVQKSSTIYTTSNYNIKFISNRDKDINILKFEKHSSGIPVAEYPFVSSRYVTGPPLILAVARLVPMKGLDVLLRACAILKNMEFDYRVTIIGDGPERVKLQRLINELGLSNIAILKGYCPPSEVISYLRKASVFVLPCIWDPIQKTQDGTPTALIEAMAMGVPVVSTTISGIPELIRDNVEGFLVRPNDPDELARAILKVCQMPEDKRDRLVRMARKKIEDHFNVESLTQELLSRFQAIVAKYSTFAICPK